MEAYGGPYSSYMGFILMSLFSFSFSFFVDASVVVLKGLDFVFFPDG